MTKKPHFTIIALDQTNSKCCPSESAARAYLRKMGLNAQDFNLRSEPVGKYVIWSRNSLEYLSAMLDVMLELDMDLYLEAYESELIVPLGRKLKSVKVSEQLNNFLHLLPMAGFSKTFQWEVTLTSVPLSSGGVAPLRIMTITRRK